MSSIQAKLSLNSSIQYLKGVGERKAILYNKMAIFTIRDLIFHLPKYYEDMDIKANPNLLCVKITKEYTTQFAKGLKIYNLEGIDQTNTPVKIVFFNMLFAAKSLKKDQTYYLYGTVTESLTFKKISCPKIIDPKYIGKEMPVYGSTLGLSSKIIAKDIQTSLSELTEQIVDGINVDCLPSLDYAVRNIHNFDDKPSRDRITLSKMYTYSLNMLKLRGIHQREKREPIKNTTLDSFYKKFSFSPTEGQLKAIEDIKKDMQSGKVMHRLLEGDVGCGKTFVAEAAAYLAVSNGMQVAFMAPTEILAEQHYKNLSKLFDCSLITGTTPKSKRDTSKPIIIGTHALFSKDILIPNLGLVITDEQHRFGVLQRDSLENKGKCPHVLSMSATPIPRTLSLVLYGDMDISVIETKPSNRIPIKTLVIDNSKLKRALDFIKDQIKKGFSAYIVCPLIEDEESELTSSVEFFDKIKKEYPSIKMALLHGKLKPNEKDEIMHSFVDKKIDLLVSTTVIEVGVDVSSANVILIMNAERFGLSQLHQLRGRVGRGSTESYCILVSNSKTTKAQERLKIMRDCSDGFTIANEDLRLRGPGDILGTEQSGAAPIFLSAEPKLLELAKDLALKTFRGE